MKWSRDQEKVALTLALEQSLQLSAGTLHSDSSEGERLSVLTLLEFTEFTHEFREAEKHCSRIFQG